jgi:hypothetical protein
MQKQNLSPTPFQPLLLHHPAHPPALLLHHPAHPPAGAARSGAAGARSAVKEGEKERMLASLLLSVPCSYVSLFLLVGEVGRRGKAGREEERGRLRSPAGGGRACWREVRKKVNDGRAPNRPPQAIDWS